MQKRPRSASLPEYLKQFLGTIHKLRDRNLAIFLSSSFPIPHRCQIYYISFCNNVDIWLILPPPCILTLLMNDPQYQNHITSWSKSYERNNKIVSYNNALVLSKLVIKCVNPHFWYVATLQIYILNNESSQVRQYYEQYSSICIYNSHFNSHFY